MKARFALSIVAAVLALGLSACGGSQTDPSAFQIAFVTSRDGDYAIYGMRADGSDQARLTDNPVDDPSASADVFFQYEPDWSPDGTRITFTSRRDGRSHVYVMNTDGSGTKQLTSGTSDDSAPAWSPDGAQIAFSRGNHLYVVPVSGGEPRRVTHELGGEEREPAWSPDGKWIVYTYRRPAYSTRELWRVRPDGSGRGPITRMNAHAIAPSFSPDGTKIVFSSDANDNRYQLYEIGATGKGLKRLTYLPTDYFDPSWSPDGTSLVFEHDGLVYTRNAHGIESALTDGPNDGSPAWRPAPSASG
jgi:Tol biopolymer transport system component